MINMSTVIEWTRRRRLVRHPRLPRVVALDSRGELPRKLDPRRVYLIGDPAKWAVFRCPCGQGQQVSLNLVHRDRAHWTVGVDDQQRPTIKPSIDIRDLRRCHFWLTAGRVNWCSKAPPHSSR